MVFHSRVVGPHLGQWWVVVEGMWAIHCCWLVCHLAWTLMCGSVFLQVAQRGSMYLNLSSLLMFLSGMVGCCVVIGYFHQLWFERSTTALSRDARRCVCVDPIGSKFINGRALSTFLVRSKRAFLSCCSVLPSQGRWSR
mgnify:CR=1 FL=1